MYKKQIYTNNSSWKTTEIKVNQTSANMGYYVIRDDDHGPVATVGKALGNAILNWLPFLLISITYCFC